MNNEYRGKSGSLTPQELQGWTYTLVMRGTGKRMKPIELVRHNRHSNLVGAGRSGYHRSSFFDRDNQPIEGNAITFKQLSARSACLPEVGIAIQQVNRSVKGRETSLKAGM